MSALVPPGVAALGQMLMEAQGREAQVLTRAIVAERTVAELRAQLAAIPIPAEARGKRGRGRGVKKSPTTPLAKAS